jgi:hypothetical protein
MGNSKVLVPDKKTRQNAFDHITLKLVIETSKPVLKGLLVTRETVGLTRKGSQVHSDA